MVFTALAQQRGLAERVEADSAGLGDWHVGDEMDRRSRATLERAGYRPDAHEARQFDAGDFALRDVVVALDEGHRRALLELADEADDPAAARRSIVGLRDFDPQLAPGAPADVADPYYGGASGFTDVLEQIERSCAGLLDAMTAAGDERQPQQDESDSL